MKVSGRFTAFALCVACAAPLAGEEAAAIAALVTRSEAVFARAVDLQHGWSVTPPLIEGAREALAAGDLERARELAERALLTAEASVAQAEREAEAWKSRVLR